MRTDRGVAWLLAAAALVVLGGSTRLAAQAEYIIGPEDVLDIRVWEQPDLTGKFSVDLDGMFTFPLIGRVTAAGHGTRQLEGLLRDKLAHGFIRNPQVTVSVETYNSKKVYVVGELRLPGTYPLGPEMTLVGILSKVGPPLPGASDEVVIVRAGPGATGPELPQDAAPGRETIRVDLRQLQEGAAGKNVQLREGDTVFVPKASPVYVYGEVRTPGAYPFQSGMTVMQSLALAGGVTVKGAKGRIKIIRTGEGGRKEIKVRLGDPVQPGDTIVVPERFF